MLNPQELLIAVETKLRAIPALVVEMGGDANNINAYHDSHAAQQDVNGAIQALPHPGMLIYFLGTSFVNRQDMIAWGHLIGVALKARKETATPPDGYFLLWKLMMDGIPTGDSLNMRHQPIHDDVELMEQPSITRQRTPLGDTSGIDFFEVQFRLDELGDAT